MNTSRSFIAILISCISGFAITSCNNADNDTTIEMNTVEVDSTDLDKDTIIFPDTMASGVGF